MTAAVQVVIIIIVCRKLWPCITPFIRRQSQVQSSVADLEEGFHTVTRANFCDHAHKCRETTPHLGASNAQVWVEDFTYLRRKWCSDNQIVVSCGGCTIYKRRQQLFINHWLHARGWPYANKPCLSRKWDRIEPFKKKLAQLLTVLLLAAKVFLAIQAFRGSTSRHST